MGRRTRRVEDNHLSAWGDGALEGVKVDGPVRGRRGGGGAVFGGAHGDVDDLAAGHLDVADVPASVLTREPCFTVFPLTPQAP